MSIRLDVELKIDNARANVIVNERLREGLARMGADVQAGARDTVPVRTGRLRDSIGYKVGPDDATITDYRTGATESIPVADGELVIATGMDGPCGYGAYVELGTVAFIGRAFLRDAFDDAASRINEFFQDVSE